MNKLQEAAEKHANHFNNGQYARIVAAFKSGAQYQSEINKEENTQLLQENKELREALASAKRGCDSLKGLIDILEVRGKEMYNALESFVDFPQEDLEGWSNGTSPITITVLPMHFKNAINALSKHPNK